MSRLGNLGSFPHKIYVKNSSIKKGDFMLPDGGTWEAKNKGGK